MLTPTAQKEVQLFARKVVPVFKLLKWQWHDDPDDIDKGHYPTQQEIIETTTNLILELDKDDLDYASSGGIIVNRFEESTVEFGLEILGGFIDNESIIRK